MEQLLDLLQSLGVMQNTKNDNGIIINNPSLSDTTEADINALLDEHAPHLFCSYNPEKSHWQGKEIPPRIGIFEKRLHTRATAQAFLQRGQQ